jgi:L-gulonate 5-dehydrogenase
VNACADVSIIGVHQDGALQEFMILPATHVFPVGDLAPTVAAFIEPTSIGVHTVKRARLIAGEHVVILGAGPIGQATALAARVRGATVLVVDRLAERLSLSERTGAATLQVEHDSDLADGVGAWAGHAAPEVVIEATGAASLLAPAIELVSFGGRVVVAGLSSEPAPIRPGDLPFKELDVLGANCCTAEEFGEAVELVAAHQELVAKLITHTFPLSQAPIAMAYAMSHPSEVMKAVIRLDE